jgi:hypothetical protein
MITVEHSFNNFPLLPARPHDIQLLDDLVDGFAGTVPADKGFIDQVRQRLLAEQGVMVITPPLRNMTLTAPVKVLHISLMDSTGAGQETTLIGWEGGVSFCQKNSI